ncbi:MAG: hypothetical protein GY827_00875 [Cytophagales bacterium]|nr:hypothetical protein [Cytophagales bacterium]
MYRIISFLSFFLFTSTFIFAQDYVSLVRAYYEQVDTGDDVVQYQSLKLKAPIVINDDVAIITGLDQAYHNVANSIGDDEKISLYSFTLQLGLNYKFSEKWSSNFIFLPKIASDLNAGSDAYQLGAWTVSSYKKNDYFTWRFGAYYTTEAYGNNFTPILGFYYRSPKKRWEFDYYLPMYLDMNYRFYKNIRVGTTVRATNLGFNQTQYENAYYHVNTRDILPYIQIDLLNETLILQAIFVYAIKDYSRYEDYPSLWSVVGSIANDQRTLENNINTDFRTGFQIRMAYRFLLNKED